MTATCLDCERSRDKLDACLSTVFRDHSLIYSDFLVKVKKKIEHDCSSLCTLNCVTLCNQNMKVELSISKHKTFDSLTEHIWVYSVYERRHHCFS